MFEPGAPLDTIYFPQSGLISLLVIHKEWQRHQSLHYRT
jgi:hypothetical protein